MESQLLDTREIRLTKNGSGAPGRLGVIYVDKTTGEHYRWNPVAGVMQPASFSSPLAARTSAAVYAQAAGRMSVIALALQLMGKGPEWPFPTPTALKPITGTIRYVNPSAAVNGNGLGPGVAASPGALGAFNSGAGALSALAASTNAGDAVAFAAGTTLPPVGSTMTPAVGGVIICAYNPVTGNIIRNKEGAARIDCGGAAFDTISAVNKNNVSVECLEFINPPPGAWCVNLSGTSGGGHIRRCKAAGGGYHFAVQSSGTGHAIEFNSSDAASDYGILYLVGADDTTTSIRFNGVTNPGFRGIAVIDTTDPVGAPGTRLFSGFVQANRITDGGRASASVGLLAVLTQRGAPKITHNYGSRGRIGLWVAGTGTGPQDRSGAIIENNDFSFCEFPLQLGTVAGSGLVQYNSFTDAGTHDGVNPASPDRFSRCIEAYGLEYAGRVQGWVFRWNYLARARYFFRTLAEFPGTEAIGLGLDNNCHDCEAYGNYCERNEGQAIQANSGSGNRISGNWSVDDCCAADVSNWADDAKCAILHVANPDIYIGNNTIIQTGRAGQLHGVSESAGAPSIGARTLNNVVTGARRSAISRNLAGSTERGNLGINCAALVTNSTTQAVIAADATTIAGTLTDIDLSSPFYPPTTGGAADGTGVAPDAGSVSGSGALLFGTAPRGALHAAMA